LDGENGQLSLKIQSFLREMNKNRNSTGSILSATILWIQWR